MREFRAISSRFARLPAKSNDCYFRYLILIHLKEGRKVETVLPSGFLDTASPTHRTNVQSHLMILSGSSRAI